MMIDTGSSWVWAYSEYAVDKPEQLPGVHARPVRKGERKENLSYGMGGITGYIQEETICFT